MEWDFAAGGYLIADGIVRLPGGTWAGKPGGNWAGEREAYLGGRSGHEAAQRHAGEESEENSTGSVQRGIIVAKAKGLYNR